MSSYASFEEVYPSVYRKSTVVREHFTDMIGPMISLSNNKFNVDLSGNVSLGSNLTVNGSTTFASGTMVDANGNMTVTGATHLAAGTMVDASGNVTVTGATNFAAGTLVDANGIVIPSVTISGQSNYPGGTFVDNLGNTTINKILTVNEDASFAGGTYIDVSGNVLVAGELNCGNAASFANGTYIDAGGNINVNGNATIYDKLTVLGQTTFNQGFTFANGSGMTLPVVNGGTVTTNYTVPTTSAYSVIYFTPTAQRIITMPQIASNGTWYVFTNLSQVTGANIVIKNYNSTITYATLAPCTSVTSAGESIRLIRTGANWIAS